MTAPLPTVSVPPLIVVEMIVPPEKTFSVPPLSIVVLMAFPLPGSKIGESNVLCSTVFDDGVTRDTGATDVANPLQSAALDGCVPRRAGAKIANYLLSA